MRLPTIVLFFLSIMMIGCAAKTASPPTGRTAVMEVRWQADNTKIADDSEQICESVIVPVSTTQLNRAITMLAHASFVQVSVSQAEELIGHSFLARRAMLKEAKHHEDRSAFFTEQLQRYPNDDSARKASIEHRDTARRLRSQSSHLTPYLVRAIGLRGCGTGGFCAHRQNNEVWISFGGLGSGFSSETQAVIVYIDRPPKAVHLSDPSTCL